MSENTISEKMNQKFQRALDLKSEKRGEGDDEMESYRRLYRYETCLIPYVVENGRKSFVQAKVTCGKQDVIIRSCQKSGRFAVVVGSNVHQQGVVSVVLKTMDGTKSGRKWLNANDFTVDLNPREIEVELK